MGPEDDLDGPGVPGETDVAPLLVETLVSNPARRANRRRLICVNNYRGVQNDYKIDVNGFRRCDGSQQR